MVDDDQVVAVDVQGCTYARNLMTKMTRMSYSIMVAKLHLPQPFSRCKSIKNCSVMLVKVGTGRIVVEYI